MKMNASINAVINTSIYLNTNVFNATLVYKYTKTLFVLVSSHYLKIPVNVFTD